MPIRIVHRHLLVTNQNRFEYQFAILLQRGRHLLFNTNAKGIYKVDNLKYSTSKNIQQLTNMPNPNPLSLISRINIWSEINSNA